MKQPASSHYRFFVATSVARLEAVMAGKGRVKNAGSHLKAEKTAA
jgi:hypothetical protein